MFNPSFSVVLFELTGIASCFASIRYFGILAVEGSQRVLTTWSEGPPSSKP
jgi:hypothetical protein